MSEKTGLIPQRPTSCVYEQSTAKTDAASLADTTPAPAPVKRSTDAAAAANAVRKPGELFSDTTKQQLNVVFNRMSRPVTLALELDDTPLSTELRGFIDALVALSGGKLKSTVDDGEYEKDDTGACGIRRGTRAAGGASMRAHGGGWRADWSRLPWRAFRS